jgi:circadian clock protein KaiB
MQQNPPDSATGNYAKTARKPEAQNYVLRLYVTGTTPRSVRAISNLKKICEEHLMGRYNLDVVDLYQQPVPAQGEQIIAAPMLVKIFPAPPRTFIGDMSNTEEILVGLDLRPQAEDWDERDTGKRKSSSSVAD